MIKNDYLVGSNCNIYCKLENELDVFEFLKKSIDNMNVIGVNESQLPDNYISYRVNFSDEFIDFSILIRKFGGDKVSKSILGAYNFSRRIDTDAYSNKEYILQHLAGCNSSIGIKCSKDFSNSTREYIFNLTRKLQGIVFDGSAMLDDQGDIILDSDGFFSVLYE